MIFPQTAVWIAWEGHCDKVRFSPFDFGVQRKPGPEGYDTLELHRNLKQNREEGEARHRDAKISEIEVVSGFW